MQIVKSQINQLRTHPNIGDLMMINQNCYKLIYRCQSSKSTYKGCLLTFKFNISSHYPNKAPSLILMNKIHHLNIHPQTGQVLMSVLKSDWCPYLTLYSIFECLQNILEQPDQNLPATFEQLHEYRNENQKYHQKIQQIISNNCFKQVSGIVSFQQELFEEVIETQEIKFDKLLQQSHNFAVRQISKLQTNQNNFHRYVNQVKNKFDKEKDFQPQNCFIKQNGQKAENGLGLLNLQSIHFNNNKKAQTQRPNHFKQPVENIQRAINGGIDELLLTMKKMNDTIQIFTKETSNLEINIQDTKNQQLKSLMQKSYVNHNDMLKMLYEMSQQIKTKIMQHFKKEITKCY